VWRDVNSDPRDAVVRCAARRGAVEQLESRLLRAHTCRSLWREHERAVATGRALELARRHFALMTSVDHDQPGGAHWPSFS
jgi:hypothetical protein